MKDPRVRLKPLPAREQARLDRDVAELATLSTGELRKRARPLTAAQRVEWERARRGRPRKAPGAKAARVLFTIDPDLLKRVDQYARLHGMTRAQLIATGLRKAISA